MDTKQAKNTYFNKLNVVLTVVVSGIASIFGVAVAGDGWGPNTINGVDKLQQTFYATSPIGYHDPQACYDAQGNAQFPGGVNSWPGVGRLDDINNIVNDTCYTGKALRKFVDPLPLAFAPGGPNGDSSGKYVPLGVPTKWMNAAGAVTGDDYYEIAVVEYKERFHTDLKNETTIRGFVQIDNYYTDSQAGLSVANEQPIPGSKHYALTDIKGQPIVIYRPDPSNTAGPAPGFRAVQAYAVDKPHYLGPVLTASRGVPTRIKFTNLLPAGRADGMGNRNGDLFIPVDETLPGAGFGPDGKVKYTQNRAELHLHGGDNPWISDGTPLQWITPAGEAFDANGVVAEAKAKGLSDADAAKYLRGASAVNVPDMPNPGPGAMTYYYPNGESARLEWVHDHTLGMTRLNVYAGMVMPYMLDDPTDGLAASGLLPAETLPFVIQDKTFVPHDIAVQDARWDSVYWGGESDLWYPHVYETNQDPTSVDGTKPVGRWDWGPYFWPVFPSYYDRLPDGSHNMAQNSVGGKIVTTGLTEVTVTPEAFVDTPVINGTAYPTMTVDPKAYRFRILNGMNDRYVNLGFYIAADKNGVDANDPANPKQQPQLCDGVNNIAVENCTEVKMVNFDKSYPDLYYPNNEHDAWGDMIGPLPGNQNAQYKFPDGNKPETAGLNGTGWGPTDGFMAISAGVPDPITAGPDIHVIGNEGGYLANLVTIPSTIINYENNKRSITILNVMERGLWLGPAQRADVVVDFSQYAGKTLILYNDAPAPLPAGDPRIDYYTGMGDYSSVGGSENVLPGYGPNDRTLMQVHVRNDVAPANPINVDALATLIPQLHAANQPKPVVPEPRYGAAFPEMASAPETYAKIFTGTIYLNSYSGLTFTTPTAITYTPAPSCNSQQTCLSALQQGRRNRQGQTTTTVTATAGTTISAYLESKTIQELFEPTYGRMNATLGVELPFTSSLTQTTIPLGYVDPVTEKVADGETQFWKITHNGVDAHPVHFHLVNVQVLNRVGWDGTIKAPMDDEIGWKETVVMNPLEDIVVAVRAKAPALPFGLPNSVRARDPSQVLGVMSGFTQVDPVTGDPATVTNQVDDYGWEYVWHCHILGHEENDFMRAVKFDYWTGKNSKNASGQYVNLPDAVKDLSVDKTTGLVTWTDPTPFVGSAAGTGSSMTAAKNEIGFRIVRTGSDGSTLTVNVPANQTQFKDDANTNLTVEAPYTDYTYNVYAYNQLGTSALDATSTVVDKTLVPPPTDLVSTDATDTSVTLSWHDNATNETSYEYSIDGGTTWVTIPPFAGSGVVSYTVTGLEANHVYDFMVGARNSVGLSEVVQATKATTTPAVVTNLVVSGVTTTSANLAWTLPATGGLAEVAVYPVGNPAAVVTMTNQGSGAALTSLTANTAYTAIVTLYTDEGGVVLPGKPVSVNFQTLTAAPTSATAGSVTSTSAVVSWVDPNAAGTTTATVTALSGTTVVKTVTGAVNGAAVTGLASNTTYTFNVTLTNVSGGTASTAATTNAVTTNAAPATNIRFTAQTATTATVAWANTATNGTSTLVSVSPSGATVVQTANGATLSNLRANTTYTMTVGVTGKNGTQVTSTGTGTTLPAAVTSLATSSVKSTSAAVTWTNPNTMPTRGGSVTLTVLQGTKVVQTLTNPTSGVVVSGLTANTAYTVNVTVTINGLTSAVAATSFTTNAAAVTGLGIVSATDTTANIGWVLPTSGGIPTLTVVNNGVTTNYTLAAGTTNYKATGLVPNTAVSMTVVVKGTSGVNGDPATASGYTNAAAPSAVTATALGTQVTVGWTDPYAGQVNAATSATLTVLSGTKVVATYTGLTGSSYTVTSGLTATTTYTFSVTLTGTSKVASAAKTTTATTSFAAVTALAVSSVTTNSAKVTWTNPNAGTTTATLTATGTNGATVTVNNAVSGLTVSGLTPNVSYTFSVQLTAAGGGQSAPATVTAITNALPATGAVVSDLTSTSAKVAWTDTNVNADSVTITATSTSTGATSPVTVNNAVNGVTVTGLTPNAAYTFSVALKGQNGVATTAATATGTTLIVPVNTVTTSSVAATSVKVSWVNPNAGSAAATLYVYTGASATGTPVQTVSNAVSGGTVTGLTANTQYTFSVVLLAGTTGATTPATATVTTAVAPTLVAPTALSVAETSTTVATLTVTDASVGETGYAVEMAVGTGGWGVVSTTSTTTTPTAATGGQYVITATPGGTFRTGTVYKFRVRAMDAGGNYGAYSTTVQFTGR